MQFFNNGPLQPKFENPLTKDLYKDSGAIGIRRIADLFTVLSVISAFIFVITFFVAREYCMIFLISSLALIVWTPFLKGFATIIEAAALYKRKNHVG
jgi:hypothetical protein